MVGLCPSCLLLYLQSNIVLSRVTVELTKSLQTQAIPQMPYVVLFLFMTYREHDLTPDF